MSCANASRLITSNHLRGTDRYLYVQLLESCIASKSLAQGKLLHQRILKLDYQASKYPLVLDRLTRLYITCNELNLAHRIFNAIPIPDRKNRVILWNQMIRAYAWDGPFDRAIGLYNEMLENGATPSKFTYPFVLKACSGLQAIEEGRVIHEHARRVGLHSDVYVNTALVDFYAKCGFLVEARNVFSEMPSRDVVAWNAMIAGSSLHGLYCETGQLVVEMQKAGLNPNSSTILAVIPAIGEANALRQGKAVHGYCIRRNFHSDVEVGTGLLDMYGKCGSLADARRIFEKIDIKNEISWSAMIGACVSCDSTREALELFGQMLFGDSLNPSPVVLSTVLRACAILTDLSLGRCLHGYIIKSGTVSDLMVGNTILSMYAKCGDIDDAMRLFDEMCSKDTVSFSVIVSGCAQNGEAQEALQFFRTMLISGFKPDLATMIGFLPACSHLAALQHGACAHGFSVVRGYVTDISICNALIDMYSKCGKIDAARLVFDKMHTRDIVSWNAMIVGYGIHGLGREAILLFQSMLSVGLKPDDVTFISLLSACSHSGLVAEGKHWFVAMSQDFKIVSRMEHYLCMVDLLGRAGHLKEAFDFIQEMPFKPDVQVLIALLAACRVHKNIELGEEVSGMIQNLGPESTGNFVLISNLYSAAGRWADAAQVRAVQRDWGFKKTPGCSWVEVNGVVHAFISGDRSHPQAAKINEKLDELLVEMKKLGYLAQSSFVYQDVEDEEKERILLHHSEKLAVAFAILTLSPNKPIIVTKNLRVCGDCHIALKYMTTITKREIVVRDASRFHHFRNGSCNCGDFW